MNKSGQPNQSNKNGKYKIDKTVLITGASTGIGFALAKRFVVEGYKVVITGNDVHRLAKAEEQLNQLSHNHVETIAQNLACTEGAQALVDELSRREITVDILVNNAGFSVYGVFPEAGWADTLAMLQLNMLSLTQLTHLLLPAMIKRGSGRIMNLGSTGSFLPCPGLAAYCATKAYVLSFSNSLAEELRGTGVTVTTVCPGPTQTHFAERSGMDQTRAFQGVVADAESVADTAYLAMKGGRIYIVTGFLNKVMVFLGRFMPVCVANRIARWFTLS